MTWTKRLGLYFVIAVAALAVNYYVDEFILANVPAFEFKPSIDEGIAFVPAPAGDVRFEVDNMTTESVRVVTVCPGAGVAWMSLLEVWAMEPRAIFLAYQVYEADSIYGVSDPAGGWLAIGEVPEVVVGDALVELVRAEG